MYVIVRQLSRKQIQTIPGITFVVLIKPVIQIKHKMEFRYILTFLLFASWLFYSCNTQTGSEIEDLFTYDHERNPGVSAEDFLSSEEFDNLKLQIQYMQGYEPTAESLSDFQVFLEERLHKANITILEPEEIPQSGQSSYSANEVRELEREHRSEFSEEDSLAAYFIILDGEFDSAYVLGITHFNTSMALFGETIQSTSDGKFQLSRAKVESIVMQHEIGHIIGLVNNGVGMQTEHRDEENGRHCDAEDCLMYFAVRTTNFFCKYIRR